MIEPPPEGSVVHSQQKRGFKRGASPKGLRHGFFSQWDLASFTRVWPMKHPVLRSGEEYQVVWMVVRAVVVDVVDHFVRLQQSSHHALHHQTVLED